LSAGIAWIDQSDFRIVRLRTDLLAAQPQILVQKQTANILFGAVRIPTLELTLWLPQAVHAEMEARGQISSRGNISIRSTGCTSAAQNGLVSESLNRAPTKHSRALLP
jgi:hypothetical protein